MMVTQTLFGSAKYHRPISLNSHYLILFRSPRDKRQIHTLGSQLYPFRGSFFVEAYQRSTRQPYSYLRISLRQEDPEALKLVSGIFESDGPPIAFLRKSND